MNKSHLSVSWHLSKFTSWSLNIFVFDSLMSLLTKPQFRGILLLIRFRFDWCGWQICFQMCHYRCWFLEPYFSVDDFCISQFSGIYNILYFSWFVFHNLFHFWWFCSLDWFFASLLLRRPGTIWINFVFISVKFPRRFDCLIAVIMHQLCYGNIQYHFVSLVYLLPWIDVFGTINIEFKFLPKIAKCICLAC